ncbi:putative bifunctional diguanylate cyclase/phosphodiesterase [Neobacillus sp. 19]|uniref:putative bifunctional diguanylate cyclase/phosphodiesterase n=1 Tax=Neobacillus sp. 19 TaxID=3394458 RepID=UPI003BF6C7D1
MYVFHIYYLFIICILLVITFMIGRFFRIKNDRLQSSLQATNEKMYSFFTHTSDAINITNLENELLYVNSSFEQMYGWKRDELIGKPLPIIPAGLWEEEKHGRELLLKGEAIRNWEAPFLRKDGSFIDVNLSVSPLRDADGMITGFAAITRDMTEKKQYEQKLIELAFYDPLTGAGNRRSFYQQLAAAIDESNHEGRSVSLFYLDCDQFKLVNDTMGHTIGDELLQQLVGRIQGMLPSSGSIYRLGGDEFAIILPEVSSHEEITRLADELLAGLQIPWTVRDFCFEATCSIGISLFPQDGLSQEALISKADHALYKAKAAGRNRYRFYTNESDEKEALMTTITNDLKDAIRNGDFYLVYQPEVNLETGAVECLEVLLRYRHPVYGEIPPAEFIPIAEQTGLIEELTVWVMNQVGEQARKWTDAGYGEMRFGLNLSPAMLQQDRSFSMFLDALHNSPIPPSCLEVEIREEVFLENLFDIMDKLYTLKKLGVTVSLDDFGTAYTSIDYLKHLPIDKVKIDRTVIQGVFDGEGVGVGDTMAQDGGAMGEVGLAQKEDRFAMSGGEPTLSEDRFAMSGGEPTLSEDRFAMSGGEPTLSEDRFAKDAMIKSIVALEEELEIAIIAVGVETQEQITYLLAAGLKYAQGYYFSKPLLAGEIEEFGFLLQADGSRAPEVYV